MEAKKELANTQILDEVINAIEDLEKFYETRRSRRNGGIPASAPSATSAPPPAVAFVSLESFTEDWSSFELDGPKFKDAFKGNFIDLGAFRFISLQVV